MPRSFGHGGFIGTKRRGGGEPWAIATQVTDEGAQLVTMTDGCIDATLRVDAELIPMPAGSRGNIDAVAIPRAPSPLSGEPGPRVGIHAVGNGTGAPLPRRDAIVYWPDGTPAGQLRQPHSLTDLSPGEHGRYCLSFWSTALCFDPDDLTGDPNWRLPPDHG